MRRLPIYFLIDVSESMVGEPIGKRFKTAYGQSYKSYALTHTLWKLYMYLHGTLQEKQKQFRN